jgi:uncharacterized OsmC-like protein
MSTASISESLQKMGDVFAADPERAHSKGVPATARLVNGLRFDVSGPGGEKVSTDMPAALGGAASAPAPGWLLRAATASCTATVMAMRAARLGFELSTLEVTVQSEADQRGLLGLDEKVSAAFTTMRILVKIGADGVDPDELRGLASWGDDHSPVACTVRETPLTTVDVEIV